MGAAAVSLPFDIFIDLVQPYTKSSRERLLAMAKACQRIDADKIAGDIVECGIWRGGNIILARMLCPERTCWLFDTFEGMAGRSKWDINRSGIAVGAGKSAVSIDEVVDNFKVTNTYDFDKLQFVKGKVEDTLLRDENLPEQIALLRLDTDWYHSTKIELQKLWPRLRPGGILIIDDYGHWLGCRKAVDEFFKRSSVKFQRIDYTAIMIVK
jgi:O-methyltransferase